MFISYGLTVVSEGMGPWVCVDWEEKGLGWREKGAEPVLKGEETWCVPWVPSL